MVRTPTPTHRPESLEDVIGNTPRLQLIISRNMMFWVTYKELCAQKLDYKPRRDRVGALGPKSFPAKSRWHPSVFYQAWRVNSFFFKRGGVVYVQRATIETSGSVTFILLYLGGEEGETRYQKQRRLRGANENLIENLSTKPDEASFEPTILNRLHWPAPVRRIYLNIYY